MFIFPPYFFLFHVKCDYELIVFIYLIGEDSCHAECTGVDVPAGQRLEALYFLLKYIFIFFI